MVIEDTEPIELLNMERGELQAGNIGLSSAEVKSLLSCGQKALIDAQATVYARHQQCEQCKNALRFKGHNTIVLRTLYGKIDVDSPRFYRCICRTPRTSSRASFSPLAEILPERTTPEFQYFPNFSNSLIVDGCGQRTGTTQSQSQLSGNLRLKQCRVFCA